MSTLVIHRVRGPLRFEYLLTFSLHCNHTCSLDHYSFSCPQDVYLTSSLLENHSKGLNTDMILIENPYNITIEYGYTTNEWLCLIRDLSQRVTPVLSPLLFPSLPISISCFSVLQVITHTPFSVIIAHFRSHFTSP